MYIRSNIFQTSQLLPLEAYNVSNGLHNSIVNGEGQLMAFYHRIKIIVKHFHPLHEIKDCRLQSAIHNISSSSKKRCNICEGRNSSYIRNFIRKYFINQPAHKIINIFPTSSSDEEQNELCVFASMCEQNGAFKYLQLKIKILIQKSLSKESHRHKI